MYLLADSQNVKSIIEKLDGQVKDSEIKLKEMVAEVRDLKDKLIEKS